MTQQQASLDEALLDGMMIASGGLSALFGGTDDWDTIAPFAKLMTAMRGLSSETITGVALPFLAGFFNMIGADPTTDAGRNEAHPFVDTMAAGLNDITQIVYQQMQREAQRRQQMTQGLLVPA